LLSRTSAVFKGYGIVIAPRLSVVAASLKKQDATTQFPQEMLVDYVRVFSKS